MGQIHRRVKVFLDSNVILSGLLSDKGAPRLILDLFCAGIPIISGQTGEYNLMEIERNLSRKLPAALPVYQQYLPRLNLEIIPLPMKAEIEKYRGMTADKDVPVLVSAMNGKSDFLVTGDRKDFDPLKKQRLPFAVVTPAEFLEIFSGLVR
jgi:predicted nucleic acid-binding protein